MTKEEAYADKLISRSELIDKIYDDFDLIMQEYQSKIDALQLKYADKFKKFESKFTRVEIISAGGRVFCDRCDDNRHYKLSIQDDGKTLKLFEVKEKQ